MRAHRVCLLAAAALLLAAPPAPAQSLVRGILLDAASGGALPEGTVVISANRGRWQRDCARTAWAASSSPTSAPGRTACAPAAWATATRWVTWC